MNIGLNATDALIGKKNTNLALNGVGATAFPPSVSIVPTIVVKGWT